MIKLSLCIISLGQRLASLSRVLEQIIAQPRSKECEIVIVLDWGQMPAGGKRNRVLDAAHGRYVACIDDDDEISPNYIARILEAIDSNPGIDAILIRGLCTANGTADVEFDYRLNGTEGEWITDDKAKTIWRSPGHLCPIRADITRQAQFPQPARGEDLAWSAALRPLIKTAARAGVPGEVLYFYRLDPLKITPRTAHALRSHEEIFTPQYSLRSGPGSKADYARPYIGFLRHFVSEHKIKSLIDLGCGDMEIMSQAMNSSFMEPITDAIFVDCIAERIAKNREAWPEIQFARADLRTFPLDADLIVCKDVLQHWSTAEVQAWLQRLYTCRDQFRFALITNCNYGTTVNQPISTGGWRALDLTKPPFELRGEDHVAFQWGDESGGFKDVVLIKGRG